MVCGLSESHCLHGWQLPQRNDVPHIALSGAGVFLRDEHPLNASFLLRGPCHSNQWAELEAALCAMCMVEHDLLIITDSMFVAQGLRKRAQVY